MQYIPYTTNNTSITTPKFNSKEYKPERAGLDIILTIKKIDKQIQVVRKFLIKAQATSQLRLHLKELEDNREILVKALTVMNTVNSNINF